MSEETKKPTEDTEKPKQENSQNAELLKEDLDRVAGGVLRLPIDDDLVRH